MEEQIRPALEAALFAAGEPVPIARISLVMGVSEEDVTAAAESLRQDYENRGSGIRLLMLDKSLQLCSAPEYSRLIARVIEYRNPPRLSQPALEALAVIAYFQPVTRAYVEQVRGVDSFYTVGALADKGLIESCGKLDAPGRPTMYRTTEAFLRVMGVSSIDQLPPLPDMKATDGMEKLRTAIDEYRGRGEQLAIEIPEENTGG